MSSFMDFDAMLREKTGAPPTFHIGGQDFTCRTKVPWRKLDSLVFQIRTGLYAEDKTEQDLTEDFFKMVIIKDDRQRFIDLLNADGDDDDDEVADYAQVGKLTNWLMDIYLKRFNETQESEPEPAVAPVVPLHAVPASLNPAN